MRRSGFLLGLFSIGGQVLLLRELIATFNGDELFIGTALFGWLIAVALGAFRGGSQSRISERLLFIAGSIILPVTLVSIRLSPLLITDHVGEFIPLVQAALLSMIAMTPVGLISGWLFSAIVKKEGFNPAGIIGTVYLYEGLGAFAGGGLIAVAAGSLATTISLALILAIVIVIASIIPGKIVHYIISLAGLIILSAVIVNLAPGLERRLDSFKYEGYRIAAAFDTPYSHQAILRRDESTVLMTNSSIEASYPDRQTTENILVPPLLYYPEASSILYIGRAEFGVAQMAESLGIDLFAVDPRARLSDILDNLDFPGADHIRFIDDPVGFLAGGKIMNRFDVIIVNAGDPGNYLSSRLLGDRFLALAGKVLKSDGIIYIPTLYDTDRYITPETEMPLAIIYNTLRLIYVNVGYWPGNRTLFFASPGRGLTLWSDSLLERIGKLNMKTEFIHSDYLFDRLNFLKIQRLEQALAASSISNTLKKPILPHYQAYYRSPADSADRMLTGFILKHPHWVIIFPLAVLYFFINAIYRNRTTNRYALFLFFVAGLVSLSFELLTFYLYQSIAGSLYGEMAILIGAFMLGLALGTYYSLKVSQDRPLEFPALIMLLVAGLIFMSSWQSISSRFVLPYYALFLFVTALSTGTLFIGATNRYYADNWISNRGAGYGWEILGSSAGALLTTTILLPVIGLSWLLWSLLILTGLTLTGAVITARG